MKGKVVVAFLLGLVGFFLGFFLGEEVRIPASIVASEVVEIAILAGGLGFYFLLCAFLLCLSGDAPLVSVWPIVTALSAVLLLTALIAAIIEPDRGSVILTAGIALLTVVCSWVGATLGVKTNRRMNPET